MRPEDEWEPEPSCGAIPDPATRHWRHPSELGAMGPMTAAPDTGGIPVVDAGAAPTGGWRWPVSAVGGGLAVVAVGAVLLSVGTGPGPTLTAGPVPTLVPAMSAAVHTATTPTLELFGSDSPPATQDSGAGSITEGSADPGAPATTLVSPSEAVPPSDGAAEDQVPPVEPPPAPDRPGGAAEANDQPIDDTAPTVLDAAPPLTEPAPGMRGPFGPAVYAEQTGSEPLASFVSIDNLLLTSARAVAQWERVYLLIDQSWIPATVALSDARTDVAVLQVDPAIWELGMPTDRGVSQPIGPDTKIFVGYCPQELLLQPMERTNAASSCGPVNQQRKRDQTPSDVERRIGNVWSTAETVDQLAGYNAYDLIKTSVPKDEEMAGAALRNTAGDVVGLVVSADTPNVAAIPIDRALRTARSLLATGTAPQTWLGLQSVTDGGDLKIRSVDPDGPAAGVLEPGDRITGLNGVAIQGGDHLIHLLRLASVGDAMEISFVRDRTSLVATVVAQPPPTPTPAATD